MTAFVGRLRLIPRQQPRTKLQACRGRGSVAIRSKIAIDVFSIFLYYDDDGDKKPISREGVIYERLSAKIVLSQAWRSRASHRMHSSLAKARFGPADIYPFPYPLFIRINCDFIQVKRRYLWRGNERFRWRRRKTVFEANVHVALRRCNCREIMLISNVKEYCCLYYCRVNRFFQE